MVYHNLLGKNVVLRRKVIPKGNVEALKMEVEREEMRKGKFSESKRRRLMMMRRKK